MPHALISSDLYRDRTLQTYLQRWGWTCEEWDGQSRRTSPAGAPDRVVLLVSTPAAKQARLLQGSLPEAGGAGADFMPAAAAALPVLVVRAPDTPDAAVAGGVVLSDLGRDGSRLRGALQACLALAAVADPAPVSAHADADMLDFLGHELRTPLAAIRTALEVLAADLAVDLGAELGANLGADLAPDPGAATTGPQSASTPDQARKRMVEIALRNVQRLGRTVDWGQAMLRGDAGPQPARVVGIGGEDLADRLERIAPVSLGAGCGCGEVHTDPELLADLAGQMVSTIQAAYPDGRPVRLRLQGPAGEDEVWRLCAALDDERTPGPDHMVVRTLLAGTGSRQAGLQQAGSPAAELARLARILVCNRSCAALAAELIVQESPAGSPALVLTLPAAIPACP